MTIELERLDALVRWMRKRGVGALTSGDATISLATLQDPAEAEAAAKAAAAESASMSAEERRERERADRAARLYGPMVRRRDGE